MSVKARKSCIKKDFSWVLCTSYYSARWRTKKILRLLTCKNRILPSFLVVGAQKAGTSSLFSYLVQHPQIVSPLEKELNFFNGHSNFVDRYALGLKWYRLYFPHKSETPKEAISGEATPVYLFHPGVPERIAKHIPEVRIIILLRDPVDRAISHYFHMVSRGREALPIDDAMDQEEERLRRDWERGNYRSRKVRDYSYKARGHYKEQIDRYRRFFRSDQLLVMESSEFFAFPESALYKVFGFLGVEEGYAPKDLRPRNVGSYDKKNYSKAVLDVRRNLADYFRPHNLSLFDDLGRSFDWKMSSRDV